MRKHLIRSLIFLGTVFAAPAADDDYILQRVNLNFLTNSEILNICDLAKDEDALKQRFGNVVGKAISWGIWLLPKNSILDSYKEEYADRYRRMPVERKINIHYLIFDKGENFIGKMAFTQYVENFPEDIDSSKVVEMAWGMMPGTISSENSALVLKKAIENTEEIKGEPLIFGAHPDNIQDINIAMQLGFNDLNKENKRKFNLKVYTIDVPTKYFLKNG